MGPRQRLVLTIRSGLMARRGEPREKLRRVAFARINRRTEQRLDDRPFDAEMRALADSHLTKAEWKGREWTAADLAIEMSGRFMTGILGFMAAELLTDFDIAN